MLNAAQSEALRVLAADWENSHHLSPEPDYSMGHDAGQQSAAWALEEVLDSVLFKAPAEVFVVNSNEEGHADLLGVRASLDEAKVLVESMTSPYFGGPLPDWSQAQRSGDGKVFYDLTVKTGPNDYSRYDISVEPLAE